MGELTIKVETIDMKVERLLKAVHDLTILVMKDKVDTTWVSEEDAAAMLNLTPAWFRRKVKAQEYPYTEIEFRNTNGRNWQYSRKGILKFKNLTSTKM